MQDALDNLTAQNESLISSFNEAINANLALKANFILLEKKYKAKTDELNKLKAAKEEEIQN